jgi:hypothetical protein
LRKRQSSLSPGGGPRGLLKYSIVNSLLVPFPENCWTHAGLRACARSGEVHADAACGGENRSGGAAKGTPRNAFAANVTEGWFASLMVVPTMTPEATVTVGAEEEDEVVGAEKACGKVEHSKRSSKSEGRCERPMERKLNEA